MRYYLSANKQKCIFAVFGMFAFIGAFLANIYRKNGEKK